MTFPSSVIAIHSAVAKSDKHQLPEQWPSKNVTRLTAQAAALTHPIATSQHLFLAYSHICIHNHNNTTTAHGKLMFPRACPPLHHAINPLPPFSSQPTPQQRLLRQPPAHHGGVAHRGRNQRTRCACGRRRTPHIARLAPQTPRAWWMKQQQRQMGLKSTQELSIHLHMRALNVSHP